MARADIMNKVPDGQEHRNSAEIIEKTLDSSSEFPGVDAFVPASDVVEEKEENGRRLRTKQPRRWLPFPCDCTRVSELPIQERHLEKNWNARFDFVCADCRSMPFHADPSVLADESKLSERMALMLGISSKR